AHGRTLFGIGQLPNALESLERYLPLYPNDAEAYNDQGLVLSDLHRLPEAIQSFEHSIRLKPDFAPAHFHRAVSLAVQGRYEEAIASYDEALRLDPGCPWALGGLAHLKMMQCDWTEWQLQLEQLHDHVSQGKPVITPLSLCSFSDSASLQKLCAQKFTE